MGNSMPEIKKSDTSREYAERWILQSDAPASIATLDLGRKCRKDVASRLYLECFKTLKFICQLQPTTAGSEARMVLDVKRLKEQLGRFFLWGESLSDGSLDKALDQSDELKDIVLTLLCDMARELLSDELQQAPFLNQLKNDIEPLLDEAQEIIHSSSLKSTDIGDEAGDDASTVSSISSLGLEQEDSQHQTLSSRLEPLITDLVDLSPTIERNIIAISHSPQIIQSDVSAFIVSTPALPYVSVVRDKFPNAAPKLIERLGEANWQRHIVVRERMEKGVEKSQVHEGTNKAVIFPQHGTVSLFHDSGIGTSIPAQSRRAASMASHTSFVSTLAEGGQNRARVPPTPREVDQGFSFKCSICHSVQTNIRNRVDWKMHVFADLRPYICTFPDCSNEMLHFPTRSAWAEHEFNEHRVKYVWKCMRCSEELESPEAWRDHLKRIHRSTLPRAELERAMSLAFRCRDAPIENEQCHLCQENPGRTRRAIVKHVGRHLEDIALIVLPKGSEDDSDEGSEVASDISELPVERTKSPADDTFSNPVLKSSVNDSDEGSEVASDNSELPVQRTESPADDTFSTFIANAPQFNFPSDISNRPHVVLQAPDSADGSASLLYCPICEKSITSTNLRRHINEAHRPKKRIPCPDSSCTDKFVSVVYVKKHIERKHPNFFVEDERETKDYSNNAEISNEAEKPEGGKKNLLPDNPVEHTPRQPPDTNQETTSTPSLIDTSVVSINPEP